KLEWNGPVLDLPDDDLIPSTVRINDVSAYPGQVQGQTLLPVIFPLLTNGQFQQSMLSHGKLVTVPGALRGEFISELLAPGNLGRWTKVEYEADGDVKIDLLPRAYFLDPGHAPVAADVPSGTDLASLVPPEQPGLLPLALSTRPRPQKGGAP